MRLFSSLNTPMHKSRLLWIFPPVYIFYISQFLFDWPLLRQSRIRGIFNFEDFVTIFTSAACFREIGLQIYLPTTEGEFCFYPYGRAFIYFIDLFRIPAVAAPALIILVALSILELLRRELKDVSKFQTIYILLSLLSPPVWLAIERGNADLMICLLVMFAALAMNYKRPGIALVIIFVATIVKFYTLPLLIILVVRQYNSKFRSMGILLCLASIVIIYSDIKMQNLQQPGSFAFGAPIVTFMLNAVVSNLDLPFEPISVRTGHILGILLIIFLSLLLKRFKFFLVESQASINQNSSIFFFEFLSIVYISCFLLGMNYDYRLIFSVMSGIFFFLTFKVDINAKIFAFFWLVSLWLSVYSFGLSPAMHLMIQWLGNIFGFFVIACLISFHSNNFYAHLPSLSRIWGVRSDKN